MPTNEEKLSSVQPTQDEVASDNQEKTEVEAPVNTLKASRRSVRSKRGRQDHNF